MAMQIEQGTCTGRGFNDIDTSGYLKYFYDWITKTPAAGGPGWTILVDKSTYPTPQAITSVDTGTDVITITGHGFLNGERVRVTTDGTLPSPLNISYEYFVHRIDANTFHLVRDYLRPAYEGESSEYVNLTTTGSGTSYVSQDGPYIVASNNASPAVMGGANDHIIKIGYYDSVASYVYMQHYLSPGVDSVSLPYFGYNGHWIKTVDAGPFTYDFRGGEEFLLLQSRVPADDQWYRAGCDIMTRIPQLCEDPSSVYGVVTMGSDTAYTPGTVSQVITLASSGQASSFTKDNWYYIFFVGLDTSSNRRANAIYGQIDAIGTADGLSTDAQIRFNYLSAPSHARDIIFDGAIVTPYYHFVYSIGEKTPSALSGSYTVNMAEYNVVTGTIPYYSYQGTTDGAVADGDYDFIESVAYAYCDYFLLKATQDDGRWPAQKPILTEVYNGTGGNTNMNRGYAEAVNFAMIDDGGMDDMEYGVTISGEDWISIGPTNNIWGGYPSGCVILVLHTEST